VLTNSAGRNLTIFNAAGIAGFWNFSAATSTANAYGVVVDPTYTQTSGTNAILAITPTYNQSTSAAVNTDLLINRTETSVGSGTQKLIDAQVAGASLFA